MTIGASIFFLALGAILAFAVTAHVGWLALSVVGWILMLAGALGLLLGLAQLQRQRVRVVRESVPGPTVLDPGPYAQVEDTTTNPTAPQAPRRR